MGALLVYVDGGKALSPVVIRSVTTHLHQDHEVDIRACGLISGRMNVGGVPGWLTFNVWFTSPTASRLTRPANPV